MTDTDRLKAIEEKLDELCAHLTGDGNPAKGLIVRFALLEQRVKTTARIQVAVLSVLVPAIITAVVNGLWWLILKAPTP